MNGCPMCLVEEEIANHLLLHCGLVMKVWAAILKIFWMSWIMLRSVSDLLCQWRTQGKLASKRILWNLSLYAGLWKIWLEWNNSSNKSKEA